MRHAAGWPQVPQIVDVPIEHEVRVPVQVPQIQTVQRQVPVPQIIDQYVDVQVPQHVQVEVPVDVPGEVTMQRQIPRPVQARGTRALGLKARRDCSTDDSIKVIVL